VVSGKGDRQRERRNEIKLSFIGDAKSEAQFVKERGGGEVRLSSKQR